MRVLLIEDDDIDAEAVRRAFARCGEACDLRRAVDGRGALEELRRRPRPHFVLLDLNLPMLDGFGFLDAVRADAELAGVVVFVLTTSGREEDIAAAFARQAAGYFVKGKVPHAELAATLCAYWRAGEFRGG